MEMPDGSRCQVTVGPSGNPEVADYHILIEPAELGDCDYIGVYTFADPYSAYQSLTVPPNSLCFHHPQEGTDQTPVTDQNSPPPNMGVWHHQPVEHGG